MSARGAPLGRSRPRLSGGALAVIAVWLACLAASAAIVARARYLTDLSAFLPAKPTALERSLVEQLRAGPGSRLILVALEGADGRTRAAIARTMARRLRPMREFSRVEDGEQMSAAADRRLLFERRYLLSSAVGAARFSEEGLRRALAATVEELAGPAGLLLKPMVPRDPTGEMLQILEQLSRTPAPRTADGVWVSADGARTLMIAQSAAPGSDIDAQEHAQNALRTAFAQSRGEAGPDAQAVRLSMSGPGVFAVAARARIEQAAARLAIVGASLIVLLMAAVYRSFAALILGLLPVATGALVGIATVALAFGEVHGTTLGFGATLIGEAVDYSVYFFIQSSAGAGAPIAWRRRFWPTVRLGMLVSVCGFASLLPAGFPGLAQLGAYSVSGLLAAAAVTRFVLPALLPEGFAVRDLRPFGGRIAHLMERLGRIRGAQLSGIALAVVGMAGLVLVRRGPALWNEELSALSPIPVEQQRFDAALRRDLRAADALILVIVSAPDRESALRGAERVTAALQPLIDAKLIAGIDSPADFLPSIATQTARRAALPEPHTLRENLRRAASAVALDDEQLQPFLADVEGARQGALITPEDLRGTSLAAGFEALLQGQDGRFSALMPVHAADPESGAIDAERLRHALARAGETDAQVLDIKTESDRLYRGYLKEAVRLSVAGLAAMSLLLALALRSFARLARVLAPLVLAVLCIAAALAACAVPLTLLHLVGMLLIVAVGSNYALFFEYRRDADAGGLAPLTLASLAIANASTVIGFGVLALSKVPVLVALGATVAPGALLALLFAGSLSAVEGGGRSAGGADAQAL